MGFVERVLRDEERHEAQVIAAGERFRITQYDCDLLALEEGMELTEELLAELQTAHARLACIQKAFSLLSYGDLSRKRLVEKLRRSFPRELSEETAALLEERGYLNDAVLAKRYAENYWDVRSYGPMRIRQELYGKGFTADDIDEAVLPYEQAPQGEKIRALLEKKFPDADLSDIAVRKKAADWLRRYGFSWQAVSEVFEELKFD